MEPIDYKDLSDLVLLELAIWREARGEGFDGKRGVAHVIRNRVYGNVKWWGAGDWHNIILHPYQFSSFNPTDHNSGVWPRDDDPAFAECCAAAIPVFNGSDSDLTNGAEFYHDTSISWPHAWGNPMLYDNTLSIGRLKFFKLRAPVLTTHDDVQDATTSL